MMTTPMKSLMILVLGKNMGKFKFLLLIFLFSICGFSQEIPPRPNPPKLVNDFVGGLMSPDQIEALERKLVAYNDSTSTQIVIAIVKTIQPYEAADYALQLGREWGVGQKDKNNGLILLWVPGERKVSIQTGYGMEGAIPDIVASRIIREIIAPNFKELQYFDGLNLATDEIIKYASGEYQAEETTDDGSFVGFLIMFIMLIIIFWVIGKSNKNNRGGGMLNEDRTWPYTTYTGWGRQSGNWSSGGGGGWSGGGGGFGGFGGGSFGGGGASGGY
jgi:uncharacterized protein